MIVILDDVKKQGFFFVWRLRAIRGAYLSCVLRFSFRQLLENLNNKRRSEKATNCNG